MSNEIDRTRTVTWEDPMITAQAARSMSGLELFQAMMRGEVPGPPIARLLGMSIIEAREGFVVFGADVGEYLYNPIGVIHGGFTSTMLDSAMACAIHSLLPLGTAYTTLELHVNFLRPLTLQTGFIRCEGEAIYTGRRVGTAQGRVVDSAGKLYAHATTTCMILSE